MLQGFKQEKERPPTVNEVDKKIEKYLIEKRLRFKMDDKREVPEGEQPIDVLEEGKVEDRQRNFLNKMRPHAQIWNFIQDDDAETPKIEHVMRADADPNASYIDGRVANLLELIRGLGTHLMIHQEVAWKVLNDQTRKIFASEEQAIRIRFEAWQKEQEAV